MALSTGMRLGPYEVLAPLGTGGMGQVFRARDPKLGRDIAIKVLPDFLSADPQRIARFEREARTLASLNDSHIAHVYGFEQEGTACALVMELVEGEDLAERLVRGALSLDEALEVARQIIAALDAAHGQGIIHRDLKPANIRIRPDGLVKVVDFGLAKALDTRAGEGDTSDVSNAPTITSPAIMTQHGIILGTAAYMSPEQARGKAIDKRTDIWSFGCVLFEMLAGRRPFETGETTSDAIAAVLRADPEWRALPANTPAHVRGLLEKCLQKDPKRRLRDIADARWDLEERVPPPSTSLRRMWLPRAMAAAALAIAAGALTWSLKPESGNAPQVITRFSIALPVGQSFTRTGRQSVAISPDGTKIAYVASQRLYIRSADQIEPTPLAGTNVDPANLFFSSDGRWIGFWASNQLWKIPIEGGTPIKLCDVGAIPFGASWTHDRVLFGQGSGGIFEVSANGGSPKAIVKVDSASGELAHGPQLLPGDQAVLFTLARGPIWEDARAIVESLRTHERKVILEGARDARYVETGYIIYGHAHTIFAVPFNARRLEISGSPVPLVENVMAANPTGTMMFALSRSGTLAIIPGADGPNRSLVWRDRHGVETAIAAGTRPFDDPRLSPDGTQVAVHIADPDDTIWIWNFRSSVLSRLLQGRGDSPRWTLDGRHILYHTSTEAARGIFSAAADGTGHVEALVAGNGSPRSISPDGRWLVSEELTPATGLDLKLIPLQGDRQARSMLNSPFAERWGDISPDGRWLAYQSDETGRPEIHVRPFPDLETGHWQVSSGAGLPHWSRTGQELFYIAADLMAVPVRTEGRTFIDAKPVALFSMTGYSHGYDVAADERFLMVKDDVVNRLQQIVVIQNWGQELKTRVGSK